MKKSGKILIAAVLVMLIAAMMVPAWSYFTTYAEASGGKIVHLRENSRIEESFANWTKTLQVENTDDTVSVFVRAKAFAGDNEGLAYAGNGWTLNTADGYYYYGSAVAPKASTDPLNVTITPPEGADINDRFNVIVIYESVPARYNADGSAYADWTQELTVVTEEGGN